MTNWNKVKNRPKKDKDGSPYEIVHALFRSHDYWGHLNREENPPISIHSIYKLRREAERQRDERNEKAVSDYWWVKSVKMYPNGRLDTEGK